MRRPGNVWSGGTLVALSATVIGGHMRRSNQPKPVPLWDSLMAIPFGFLLIVAAVAWLVVIAPAQYFVFLICGAPARLARRSTLRVYARYENGHLDWDDDRQKDDPAPGGSWWDASLIDKPVTLTSAFSAGLLLLVRWLLPA